MLAAFHPSEALLLRLSFELIKTAVMMSRLKEPSLFDVPAFAAAHWQHNFGLCKAAQEREDNEHRND